ncbi:MAG: DUF1501 domain-containing protein [Planctomycetes bacterium]|nr:DUF1501 domain-containing protein [Planctomycetota bacterium]
MDPNPNPPLPSRRALLRGGLGAAAGLMLPGGLGALARPALPAARARAVIQVWLWGGPSHIDTFDPKPEAGNDYTGPLTGAAGTRVPGMRLGELMPELGKQAHNFSLIRSMTHGVQAHETASYLVQTGRADAEGVVFPNVGAVVSKFRGYDAGYQGLIPPYVVLTQPQGRFSEAGFLGSRYKPFATGGNPGAARFAVEGIVVEGVSDERQVARRELLHQLDALTRAMPDHPQLEALRGSEDQAYELILGDARKVFDLGLEPDDTRERYGRNTFGQSCLAARRLVESGVPYVTINSQGWDTHKQHFQTMRRKLPELDRGLAALIGDLADRGLLESTIVWCGGEFGRTPKVSWEPPWNGGRGHHGHVFSTLVAGGGFEGGVVVGESDARAERVADRPVHPNDLIAAIYELLGVDPDAPLPHPQGLDVRVMPTESEGGRRHGRLKELL